MKLTPTLIYSVLGLLVLALAGMAFEERPVVVSTLVAVFCLVVAEMQADRVRSYDEGEDRPAPSQNIIRFRALGIAIYLPREFEASQALYVAAAGFAILGWILIWA